MFLLIHFRNLSKAVTGRATNNCGEIQASIEAIRMAKGNGVKKLLINTDSKFLIDSVTKWMPGWKKKGWRTASGGEVKNKDDFERLDEMLQTKIINVKWVSLFSHQSGPAFIEEHFFF
jgi:ribonuclease HI